MADDVDIPLTVSVLNMARVEELTSALTAMLNSANISRESLAALAGQNGVLRLAESVLKVNRVIEQFGQNAAFLKQARDGRDLGRVLDESVIQKLLQVPQALAAASQSGDFKRLTEAAAAYGRQVDQIKVKLLGLEQTQTEGSKRDQVVAQRQEREALDRLKVLEERLAVVQGRLREAQLQQRVETGVQNRQVGVAVSQAFEATPEGAARAATARANLERAQQVGDARSIDAQRTRRLAANARALEDKQKFERSLEVGDANYLNRQADREKRSAERKVAQQEATYRNLLLAQEKFERAQEIGDARAIDIARTRVLRAQERADPTVQAQAARTRGATALGTTGELANDQDYIDQQAKLLRDRAQLRNKVAARAIEISPQEQGPSYDEQVRQNAALKLSREKLADDTNAALGRSSTRRGGDETLVEEFGRRAKVLAEYAALGVAFAALGKTFESVLHLENALKELGAISGATGTELERMRTVIIATSVSTPFTSKEITTLAREMVSAGISISEVTKSLNAAALLASATGGDLQKAGEILISAFEVFKIRGDDAGKVADQLTVALNSSRLVADQYAPVLQTVSVTAAEAGVSFTELNAALGAMANQGLRTTSILSTGFRQILVDLADPPKKLSDRFKELGLTTSDVDVKALGLTTVLNNLTKAGFTSGDAFAALPARTAQAFAAFLKGGEDMKRLNEAMTNSGGAAEQNAQRMESLENQLKRLGNSFIALTQNGAGPLIGTLKVLVSGATALTDAMGSSGSSITILSTIVSGVAVGALVKYVSGLALARNASAALSTATLALVDAQTLGAAAGALGGPLFLATSVAATVAIAALGLFGNASSTLTAQQEDLRTKLNDTKAAIEDKGKALEAVTQFLENTNAKERVLRGSQDELNSAITEARNRFGSLTSAMYDNITSFDGLIEKVVTLRRELRSGVLVDLVAFQEKVRVSIANAGQQIEEQRGPRAVERLLSAGGDMNTAELEDPATVARNYKNIQAGVGVNSIRDAAIRTNPAIVKAFQIIGGSGEIDPNEIAGVYSDVQKLPSGAYRDQALKQLEAINKPLRERLKLRGEDAAAGTDRATKEFEARPAYQALEPGLLRAKNVASSLSNLKDINDSGARKTVGDARTGEIDDYLKKIEELRASLGSDAERATFDKTELARAAKDLPGTISSTQKTLNLAVAKSTADGAAATMKEMGLEITRYERELSTTQDPAQRDIYLGQARASIKTRADAQREEFTAKAAEQLLDPDKDKNAIRRDLASSLRGVDDSQATALQGLDKTNNEFDASVLTRQSEAIKRKLKAKDLPEDVARQLEGDLIVIANAISDKKGHTDAQRGDVIGGLNDDAENRARVVDVGTLRSQMKVIQKRVINQNEGTPSERANAFNELRRLSEILSDKEGKSQADKADAIEVIDDQQAGSQTASYLRTLDRQLSDIKQKITTANHRDGTGKHGTAAEIAALNVKAREIVNTRLDVRGVTDPEERQAEIDRLVDQPEIRSGLSATPRGRHPADPSRPFSGRSLDDGRIAADELKRLQAEQRNADARSNLPIDEAKTFIDAAKRTENFPKIVIRDKEKELNDLKIQQDYNLRETAQSVSRQGEVALGNARAALERDTAALKKLADDNNIKPGADGEYTNSFENKNVRAEVISQFHALQTEIAKLGGANGVGGEIAAIQAFLEKNKTVIQRVNLETDVRAQVPKTGLEGVGAGIKDAAASFNEKHGLNASVETQTSDLLTKGLDGAQSSLSKFFQTLASGSVKGKDAFKQMTISILQDALKMASDKAASQVISGIIRLAGAALGSLGGGAGTVGAPAVAGADYGLGAGTSFGSISGFSGYNGGIVPKRFAGGGIVGGTDFGRDSVRALLAPGEGVLNRRAVNLIGEDTVHQMNSASVASQSPIPPPPPPRQPDNVNVYMVDKNTQPSLGPKDILAAVHSDILQGGLTKKLIHSVQLGST